MTDWGDLYRDHVSALAELTPTLTEDQLGSTVPATPLWTVREVLAHLAGGPHDSLHDQTEGAPGPQWTARHVEARRGRSAEELIAEIRSNQDAIVETLVDNPRPAVVWDIAVHHADLHEGLDLHPMPERLWQPVAEALAGRAPELAAAVPPYEFFRASFSRRSRNQMQAWGTDLSVEQLDEVCIFGPREDDQPIPA